MPSIDTAMDALHRAAGWPRRLIALGAGAAAAFGQAPFYALPLAALGYSVLVVLIDASGAKPRPIRWAAAAGWWFGFGYFLIGVHWFALSFFVQAEEFGWMAPFAVVGLTGFLGLFHGAAAALARLLWSDGWRRVCVFAAAVALTESLRGHILTGLPWNLPGQAFAGLAATSQLAAYVGVYGLSVLALIIFAAPALFVRTDARAGGSIALGATCGLAGYFALAVIGAIRLDARPPAETPDIAVRIVQPNIPQREKINPALWGRNVRRAIDLSDGPAPTGRRLFILWPENAAALIDESPAALRVLGEELPESAVLLTGAVRRTVDEEGDADVFNSFLVIAPTDEGRRPVAAYDKHHLVPFGEYLPFRGLLRALGLAQLAPYEEGFTAGPGPRTITAGGVSFSPLICYEAIFPGEMHPPGRRPDFLAAVTNDAWFGDTSGPRQHLDQARLRSIERGLPMVRAAKTGISAVIDAEGRYVARLPLYRTGVLDAPLPAARPPTVYAIVGDLAFAVLLGGVAIAGAPLGRRSGERPRPKVIE